MPKKGVVLSEQAVLLIRKYLSEHEYTQEYFATHILKVNVRTFHNWLTGRSSVELEKLEIIIRELGIGVEDFLGSNVPEEYRARDDLFPTIRLIYEKGIAAYVKTNYQRVAKLFLQHISFNKFPRTGYFHTFEHDVRQGKNYYCQVWILPEIPVEEATFTFSFTIFRLLRITYGEVILKKDSIEIKQFYQPPNYTIKRPKEHPVCIKAATWFDEADHTFIVSSQTKFRLENKGAIPEEELERKRKEMAVFWKHFFFHNNN